VVLVDGAPILYLDRGGRRLRSMTAATNEQLERAVLTLPDLARKRPRRSLLIDMIDGERATSARLAPLMRETGFTHEYLSLRLNAR
jgi:ATP-dependent Lhr-like helicase